MRRNPIQKGASGIACKEIEIQPISSNSFFSHINEFLSRPLWISNESIFSSLGSQLDFISPLMFEKWKIETSPCSNSISTEHPGVILL